MKHSSDRGFTLIELVIALVVAAALAAIAVPAYQQHREHLKVNQAKMTISMLAADLTRYYRTHNTYPATLAGLGIFIPLDPWGNVYNYVPIDVRNPPKVGKILKDKSMHPVNSDFDLYSMGEDGKTTTQLASYNSQDDVIRAGNGSYIGPASGY
ncbi:MAG: prepilin-type N-terminal cleavage/methylation domain-containing protein [Acidihalobacter sp.]|uniref:prepilin-type N-terminal cleavage/methylation domain-containing protein n=1 Tax=Acidihalobacter sp. TaxID=1872108 RepID=UPI00307F12CE